MSGAERGDNSDSSRSAVAAALLLGVGTMAALDVIVFHQILQWHHFYVPTSEYWRIASDGFFHLLPLGLLVASAVLFRRAGAGGRRSGRAFGRRLLLGAGAFQLFDGIVNHLILRVHPVREGVTSLLPYDLAWNALGLILIVLALTLRSPAEQR